LFDVNKFEYDLSKEKINPYGGKHNGHVYYKDEKAYYGPIQTYNKIPEPDRKFIVYINL
jgi:hypothetical protein